MYGTKEFEPGWFWTWVVVVAPAVIILAALISRHRLTILAVLSWLGIVGMGFVWSHNCSLEEAWYFHWDELHPIAIKGAPPYMYSYSLGLKSARGGVCFSWQQEREESIPLPPSPLLIWYWAGQTRAHTVIYPGWRDPVFDHGGFRVTWYRGSEVIVPMIVRAVTVPDWFIMVLLLPFPLLHARRALKRARIRRWLRQGRCACGFDLRAHHGAAGKSGSIGTKCPECGAAIKSIEAIESQASTT